MLFNALLLSALLAPATAIAEDKKPFFCRPATTVGGKVNDCEGNGVFANQAKECREALSRMVEQTSGSLAKAIGQSGAGSQCANFGSTAKDYGTSAAELTKLIGFATLAAADLDSYLDYVVLPEDVDNPDLSGNHMQKYAESIACFGDNVRAIRAEIGTVNGMRTQLEATRTAAAAFGATAANRGEAIKAGTLAPAPETGGKHSAVPSASYKGEDKARRSDISGTEDEKKKPAQK